MEELREHESELEPCPGGFMLNGDFIPFDIEEIDARAEADEVAGRVYDWEDVVRHIDEMTASWRSAIPGAWRS